MRIALVAPLVAPLRDPPLGGAQTVIGDLAAGLAGRGHQVDVYAASGSTVPGATTVDLGIDWRPISASRHRAGRPPEPSRAARDGFRRIYAEAGARGYDVIHNHAFDAAAVDLAPVGPAPVVHTVHLPPEGPMAASLRAARARASPAVVVAVSRAQAASWAALVPVDRVIRNGVPVGRIPFGAGPGAGAVFAGRLSPEKGAREAIEIALRAGVPLSLHGDAYDGPYASATLEAHRGTPGVTLTPALPRTQLWARLASAAAVLCPSRWEEPFGLVAAEAMAAGTPVVGYRTGGLAEIVAEGVTGILVDPGDTAAAAAALRAVTAVDRAACRRHAERSLDLEAAIDAHEALYRGRLSATG